METIKVNFYDKIEDTLLRFVVICCRYQGKWIYAQHTLRDTFEIPGGHRETGESVLQAACRELEEETGAYDYVIEPVIVYGVLCETTKNTSEETYGMLCYADVKRVGRLQHEIKRIVLVDTPPTKQTYPMIQPHLFQYINRWYKEREKRFLKKM